MICLKGLCFIYARLSMLKYNYIPELGDFTQEETHTYGRYVRGILPASRTLLKRKRERKKFLCEQLSMHSQKTVLLCDYTLENSCFDSNLNEYQPYTKNVSKMSQLPSKTHSHSSVVLSCHKDDDGIVQDANSFDKPTSKGTKNVSALKISSAAYTSLYPKVCLTRYVDQDDENNNTGSLTSPSQEILASTFHNEGSHAIEIDDVETNASEADAEAAWKEGAHKLALHLENLTRLSLPEVNLLSVYRKKQD